jgi:hypothetical protein
LTGIDPGHLGLDPMTANMRELSSGNGRIQIAGSRSGGGGCARVLGRRRAAALSPARPDLGFQRSIEHAVCTYAQLAMWRTYLVRRGRLGCEGVSAQCGGAVRCGAAAKLRRASTDGTARGDNNKWLGWPPHLLARLRGSSSMAKRQRRQEATAVLGLGFRQRHGLTRWQLGFR